MMTRARRRGWSKARRKGLVALGNLDMNGELGVCLGGARLPGQLGACQGHQKIVFLYDAILYVVFCCP